MQIVTRKITDLKPADYNPRKKSEHVIATVRDSLKTNGWLAPVVVNKNPERLDVIVGGHRRLEAATANGETEVPTIEVNLTLEQEKRLNLQLNAQEQFDNKGLATLITELNELNPEGMGTLGFSQKAIADYLYQAKYMARKVSGVLANKFLVPPFSVLDAKQGAWQDRKREWLEVLGDLAETRVGTLAKGEQNVMMMYGSGVSSFDPVLAELAYLWFSPEKGSIIDPFAGSLARGGVAAAIGRPYTGIEIRQDQVDANLKRLSEMDVEPGLVKYVTGNSLDFDQLIPAGEQYDLLFTCPPYYDLEIYSSGAGDLSAKQSYAEFMVDYSRIFEQAAARLKPNRFAVLVLGDVRDKQGFYYGFVRDNIALFERMGFRLYNEAIYLQALATAPHRAERNMKKRKVVKVHQNILTLYKGDPAALNNPALLDIHEKVLTFFKGDPEAITQDFTNPPPIERNIGASAAEPLAPDDGAEDRA